ncbi:kinase-like domain-containing protein [Geopyxis carbonaria]|nr:kinase-like domain-containing protein [Geopyxis carbonaria]
MARARNEELEKNKEQDCIGITMERKYYHVGNTFVKRNLRPREYRQNMYGVTFVPRQGLERAMNEAAALAFVRANTNVPVPNLLCAFMDDGAYHVITEFVDGVNMTELSESQRAVVIRELETHIETLHALRSKKLGGVFGLVVPPYRLSLVTKNDDWHLRPAETEEFVFCHNDISQNNVIVDPETLKIRAIIDWEYAGFYPGFFEGQFYRRIGPSVALGDEEDDKVKLLDFMESWQAAK